MMSKETALEFAREERNRLTEELNSAQKEASTEVTEKEESLQNRVPKLTTLINGKDAEIQKTMSAYDEYFNQAERSS